MRNVYLSFLGLGSFKDDIKQHVYEKTVYELDGKKSRKRDEVADIESFFNSKIFTWIIG